MTLAAQSWVWRYNRTCKSARAAVFADIKLAEPDRSSQRERPVGRQAAICLSMMYKNAWHSPNEERN